MSWDNRPQVSESGSCIRPLEDRMKECLANLKLNDDLVNAMDAMMQKNGEYIVFEHGGERLYTKAIVEQKRLHHQWKQLKREAKKKKSKK